MSFVCHLQGANVIRNVQIQENLPQLLTVHLEFRTNQISLKLHKSFSLSSRHCLPYEGNVSRHRRSIQRHITRRVYIATSCLLKNYGSVTEGKHCICNCPFTSAHLGASNLSLAACRPLSWVKFPA